MNKKVISYALLPVLGIALLGAGATFAASNSKDAKPMDALVTALAAKFNLNSSEVEKVVEQVRIEQHAAMETEHAKQFADRIHTAVTAGKLTQAQADLILAKQAELQADKPDFASKTPAEIRADMKTRMEAVRQWAKDNNIPQGYLMFGPGKQFGHGGPRGEGFKPQTSPSTIK